ncbi:MAG: hypothetical protein F6J95_004060 [Leptolyngbya sp. SIO1E4]|nr:hypothetical protein [Leptolyngbya sp. SIO1E4]
MANRIRGTANSEFLAGTAADDIIFGSGGNDVISGGDGNDIIYDGPGIDTLFGGAGDDVFMLHDSNDFGNNSLYSNPTVSIPLNGGPGYDTVDARDAVEGITIADLIFGAASVEAFRGSRFNDYVNASRVSFDVVLDGRGGDDTLIGGSGNDTLNGGSGTNFLTGGAGADRFIVPGANNANTTITDLNFQEGDTLTFRRVFNDEVQTFDNLQDLLDTAASRGIDVSRTGAGLVFDLAPTNQLTLQFQSTAPTPLAEVNAAAATDLVSVSYGQPEDTLLFGGVSDNTITAGLGSDVLMGGEGTDTFNLTQAANGDVDWILDFEQGIDRILLQNEGLFGGAGTSELTTAGDARAYANAHAGVEYQSFETLYGIGASEGFQLTFYQNGTLEPTSSLNVVFAPEPTPGVDAGTTPPVS